jgi:lysophospholipase L1-like esterase
MLDRTRERIGRGGPVTVVFYGDSISEVGRTPNYHGGATRPDRNWGAVLCARLSAAFPPLTFVERHFAIGGQNTYEGLGRVDWLTPLFPDLVFLAFGANDCGYHYLLPRETRLALESLIDGVRSRTQADVAVLSTVCFNPLQPANSEHVEETFAAQRAAAEAKQALFVDVRAAVMAATKQGERWAEYHNGAADCHPNDAGHALWAATAFEAVRPHLAG